MKTFFIGFMLVGIFFSSELYSQNIVKVTDCNPNGWVKQITDPGGTVTFVSEPPTPLLGTGSLELYTPQNFVRLRNTQYHHVLLSSFTEFSYSTFIQHRTNNTDSPWIVLQIDLNGDDVFDNYIVFNPQYQTGNFAASASVSDQGPTQENVWQTWDAMHGAWWLGPEPDPDNNGPLFTIAAYVSQHPTARIVNPAPMVSGGIRLTAGGPAGIFAPELKANVDNFKIGTNGVTTVFDFENSITAANAGSDQSVLLGYRSNCTQLTGTAAGGVAPYTYLWSPGGSSSQFDTTQVCPEITTTYTLTITDANGCSKSDNVIVNVNDVRCGASMEKVKLCHKGNEKCVDRRSVLEHLNHGDTLGGCESINLSIYPNPVSTSTKISYELEFDAEVTLSIFDIFQREVTTKINRNNIRGHNDIDLDFSNNSPGLYYYRILVKYPFKNILQTGGLIIMR